MKKVLIAAILFVGANVQAGTFPIGKFVCKSSIQNTIWVVSESADKLPHVTVTFVGTAGYIEKEGMAVIHTQFDAAGKVTGQSLRFDNGILNFDSTGTRGCTQL